MSNATLPAGYRLQRQPHGSITFIAPGATTPLVLKTMTLAEAVKAANEHADEEAQIKRLNALASMSSRPGFSITSSFEIDADPKVVLRALAHAVQRHMPPDGWADFARGGTVVATASAIAVTEPAEDEDRVGIGGDAWHLVSLMARNIQGHAREALGHLDNDHPHTAAACIRIVVTMLNDLQISNTPAGHDTAIGGEVERGPLTRLSDFTVVTALDVQAEVDRQMAAQQRPTDARLELPPEGKAFFADLAAREDARDADDIVNVEQFMRAARAGLESIGRKFPWNNNALAGCLHKLDALEQLITGGPRTGESAVRPAPVEIGMAGMGSDRVASGIADALLRDDQDRRRF